MFEAAVQLRRDLLMFEAAVQLRRHLLIFEATVLLRQHLLITEVTFNNNMVFSYAGSSTRHPCESVSHSFSCSFERA